MLQPINFIFTSFNFKNINNEENKYPTLKIIAGIYRGFAWILGVGAIIAKWRKTFNKKQYISTLIGTIIGSTIGTVMMANSLGLFVFNPLIGGLIGYYLALLKFFS